MQPVWGSAVRLLDAYRDGRLITALIKHVNPTGSPSDQSGEIGAWKRSIPALLELVVEAGLGHVHVILEHRLPYTPHRVDAILCGVHPLDGEPSYVLVELKQWSGLEVDEYGLVRNPWRDQPDLHPSEQVRRYCQHLVDFYPLFARRPKMVRGTAYLHNIADGTVQDFKPDDFGTSYAGAQRSEFVGVLKSLLDGDPRTEDPAKRAARDLGLATVKPARTLLDTAREVLAGRDSYILLDAQQVAFDLVRQAVDSLDGSEQVGNRKKVIVVQGGPGSGKSVIAISLLSRLIEHGKAAAHATGSKAFTETLREKVTDSHQRVNRLFTYFNSFDRATPDSLDVLVCDEAHRVRGDRRSGTSGQISQLIDAAKVPVFLLDAHQTVRPGEIGTLTDIVDVATAKGVDVVPMSLDAQFRCGGSAAYDEWVLRLLGLGGAVQPVVWSDLVRNTDDQFMVDSVDSPERLEAWLRLRMDNFGGTGRMAAGFCWKWSYPRKTAVGLELVPDVKIGDWHRPWNARPDKPVPGAPTSSLWASDPRGFGQVGCIYTAQGFEYAWAGVIFGPDLVIRGGHWVSRPDQSKDTPVAKCDDQDFGRFARNTYKVLLTRGMRGVCLYSTDEETNAFFRHHAR
nr:DUF2075 domain-containing protein [Kibdelosporangium sp. MJ126-NF4]CEL17350.1 ATP/GTP binding protein [Kibdelosporangium sp. MJ126-NF4]CTQ91423.1 ATP/GTP binding protein [Kibdelosporangium sp. MJ126-NF4]